MNKQAEKERNKEREKLIKLERESAKNARER